MCPLQYIHIPEMGKVRSATTDPERVGLQGEVTATAVSGVEFCVRGDPMRIRNILIAAVVLSFAALPAFSEWELGVSWTPVPNAITSASPRMDSMEGYHLAYATSIFYASWDILAVPDFVVEDWTGYLDPESGLYYPGFHDDGYLNLYDVGIRLALRPFVCFAEAGMNGLFVHGEGFLPAGFGANIRLGVGARFDWWGISVAGTSVFATWDELWSTVEAFGLPETRTAAWTAVQSSLVPSVMLIWYLR
jgi:hypothetical protein